MENTQYFLSIKQIKKIINIITILIQFYYLNLVKITNHMNKLQNTKKTNYIRKKLTMVIQDRYLTGIN